MVRKSFLYCSLQVLPVPNKLLVVLVDCTVSSYNEVDTHIGLVFVAVQCAPCTEQDDLTYLVTLFSTALSSSQGSN